MRPYICREAPAWARLHCRQCHENLLCHPVILYFDSSTTKLMVFGAILKFRDQTPNDISPHYFLSLMLPHNLSYCGADEGISASCQNASSATFHLWLWKKRWNLLWHFVQRKIFYSICKMLGYDISSFYTILMSISRVLVSCAMYITK